MRLKPLLVAAIGASAVIIIAGVLIHHVWLGDFYRANAQWWRPKAEMQSMMGLMYLGQITFGFLLTIIYAKGYEVGKGYAGQGFRFGVLMGLLLSIPSSLMHAVVYPYPPNLIWSWLLGTFLEVTAAGTFIGFLYKPAK